MEGGAEGKLFRKRKRKTRSERNLLRNSQMEEDKLGEKSDDIPPSSPHYCLRSSKVTAAPLLPAQREVRISRSITEGRLTMGLFPYSKSSDCIKRGPIQVTASMSKKVEDDMRRISNSTTASVAEFNGEADADFSSGSRKTAKNINSSSKTDNNGFNIVFEEQNKASASSSISTKSDCDLEEILPVTEIADKILMNLKSKFDKLFPTRDLNTELNSSLNKILKQSSRRVNLPNYKQGNDTLKEHLQHVPGQQKTFANHTSAFPVFQPFDTDLNVNSTIQSACIGDAGDDSESASAAQRLLSDSDFTINKKPASSSASVLAPPLHCLIASHQNHQHLPKSVTFVVPSTCLEGSNDKMNNVNNDSNVNVTKESNSCTNRSHQCYEQFATQSHHRQHHGNKRSSTKNLPLGFSLPNAFGDGNEADKPIIINIDSKNGEDSDNDNISRLRLAKYSSFVESARSLKAKLENEQKHTNKSNESSGSYTIQGSKHRSSGSFHHSRHHHYYDSHIPTMLSSGSSNLAQSRYWLKTALDSILIDPPGKSVKSSVPHCNEESMDWQDVDILTDTFPHTNNYRQQHNVHTDPQDQLRLHQSDMQHQARSFLDHIDEDIIGNGHSPTHRSHSPIRPHLYPLSSTSCPTQAWL